MRWRIAPPRLPQSVDIRVMEIEDRIEGRRIGIGHQAWELLILRIAASDKAMYPIVRLRLDAAMHRLGERERTVLVLRYFEHTGSVRKAISVLKKRTGAHEESIRELRFDSDGIHLSEPLLRLRGVLTGVPVDATAYPERGVQPLRADGR